MEATMAGATADDLGGPNLMVDTPDLKTFRAKIGELALENDF
jgi:hypothetical protein